MNLEVNVVVIWIMNILIRYKDKDVEVYLRNMVMDACCNLLSISQAVPSSIIP